MVNFDISQVKDPRIPMIESDMKNLDLVLSAIAEAAPDALDRMEIRVGAVWDRKGYPDYGHVSARMASTPYRRSTGTEDILVTVALIVHRDRRMPPKFKALVDHIEAEAEAAMVAAETRRTAATRAQITSLRAQADRLEQELGQ